jgi:type VI secretion system protein ImpJ
VIEAKLSREALRNHQVEFTKLRAIMPSGTEVDFPHNAYLAPLSILPQFRAGINQLRVFLAVPRWTPNQPNASPLPKNAAQGRRERYLTYELPECPDENSGLSPQVLTLRRLNARLLLESDDDTNFEKIEIIRIEKDARDARDAQALPHEDHKFVPPCLLVRGSDQLRQLFRDLLSEVQTMRDALAQRVVQSRFTHENPQPRQYEKLLRLRTLNRFASRFSSLLEATEAGGMITPFSIYLECREFLGELAALRLDSVEYLSEDYSHDDPWPSFERLCWRIRSLLPGTEEERPLSVEFVSDGAYPVATLEPQLFSRPNYYYLAVKGPVDAEAVRRHVEASHEFKLISRPMIEQGMFVEGIRLRRVAWLPPALPAGPDLHYFQLELANTLGDTWDRIQACGKMTIFRVAGNALDPMNNARYTLYMTLPPRAETK